MGPATVSALVLGVALVVRHPATPFPAWAAWVVLGVGCVLGAAWAVWAACCRPRQKPHKPLRCLIVGCGAVGSVVGYHLARGGAKVGFLVRGPRARALDGLRLQQLGLCTCSRGEGAVIKQVCGHLHAAAAAAEEPFTLSQNDARLSP
jgi:hypothetical protein